MIDFKKLAASAVALGFKIAGSLTASGTYNQPTSGGYDPLTGTTTPVVTTINITGAIVLAYKEHEVDGDNVHVGDEKVLIQKTELAGLTGLPSENDYIVLAGIRRDVIGFTLDAAGSLYTVQTRRIAK